jgi:transglutaminase superfamily protein
VTATPGRWIASAVVVAAAAFAGAVVARSWVPAPPPADLVRYPEVEDADCDLVRACWSALGHGRTALVIVRPDDGGAPGGPPRTEADPGRERQPLFQAVRDAPASATRALLRVLCVWRFQPMFEFEGGSGAADTPGSWLAAQLREHAGAEDVRVLGRIAADPALAPQARRLAVDAIARPDDPVAAEVLEGLALDRGVELWIRRLAVERLPRLHAPLSPRIRGLLDEPFGRLDEAAAVALLRSGDAEAPSLAVEALRDVARQDFDRRWADAICAALRPLIAGDADMEARLSGVRSAPDALRAADAMDAWIAAHPARFASEFEGARREWLGSGLPSLSIDDVAQSGADFDLGTVLLATDDSERDPASCLERLDRLARAVRRDAGPEPTPDRWIEALNERLLRRPIAPEWPVRESELGYVLRTGHGNCMGLSSLYLAVSGRLGLPVFGVEAPAHVFARWDDGTIRRNVECTERGAMYVDAGYDGRGGFVLAPSDAASGAYLADLTKRQFLALALVNRSNRLRDAGDVPAAAWAIDGALRLDPRCANALVARANLRSRSPRADDRAAGAADVREAESIRSLTPAEADFAADAYFAAGTAADALRLADAVARDYPGSPVVGALRAKGLLRLGRRDEARAAAADALARAADDPLAHVDAAEALAVSGDPAWGRAFDALGLPADAACHASTRLATRLLDGSSWHEPFPRAAAEALDRAEEHLATADRGDWGVLQQRERILVLRVRCCRALGDDAGALAAEAALAKIGAK